MMKKSRLSFLLNRSPRVDRMLRVNHAGEYGAVCIYSAQERYLSGSPFADEITRMKEQEMDHLKFFEAALLNNNVSPTVFLPLWSFLGSILGFITAKCGIEYVMLCTAAVEEVIDRHYSKQVLELGNCELSDVIESFRLEEVEHMNAALKHDVDGFMKPKVVKFMIKSGCKIAIFLSEHI